MESVWDYPRPPMVEPSAARVVIELDGEVLADTGRSLRVLETSHPPVYYIPAADVRTDRLAPSARRSTWCEYKGTATYFDAGDHPAVAWTYPSPAPATRPSAAATPSIQGGWTRPPSTASGSRPSRAATMAAGSPRR